jgi:AcrR family transcriptional regulator
MAPRSPKGPRVQYGRARVAGSPRREGEALSTAATAGNETDARSAPRSRKGMRTRARLVEAGKEIFEESGFLEARISDIAERAGLSHGSFYHYFDSKEQIFREVAEVVEERLSEPMFTIVLAHGSTDTPRERLRRALRAHLESYRDEAKIMGVIEQMARYDERVRAVRQARQKKHQRDMAESIRRMQQRGIADPALDPAVAAAALGAMTSRFAEAWLVDGYPPCSMDQAVEQLTTLFVNAMGIREDRAPARPRVLKAK